MAVAAFRSRRADAIAAEGRWSAVPVPSASATDRHHALVQQWLHRHGVVTRDSATAEGGFAAAYPVLRALEDSGQLVRGHFVADLAAMQFATRGAVELLRSHARPRRPPPVVAIGAADVASPFGLSVPWPGGDGEPKPRRVVGATVISVDGAATAWLSPDLAQVRTWLPDDDDARAAVAEPTAVEIARAVRAARTAGEPATLERIDGVPATAHPLTRWLVTAGLAARGDTLVMAREWHAR